MLQLSIDLEKMYKAHYKSLRNVVENIVGDKEASHDIVQDVFLKLWSKKENVDLIRNQKAYLTRSVINSSLTYLETNKDRVRLSGIDVEAAGSPETGIMAKELEARIEVALAGLPPKCKAIFVLSRFEGMKYKEIADHLDVSEKTVENQVGIALKKMREDLKPYISREFLGIAILMSMSVLLRIAAGSLVVLIQLYILSFPLR